MINIPQNLNAIAGIIIGGLMGWLITHLYYQKSKKDNDLSENRVCQFIGKKAVEQIKESIHKKKDANEILENIWKFLTSKYGDGFMELR